MSIITNRYVNITGSATIPQKKLQTLTSYDNMEDPLKAAYDKANYAHNYICRNDKGTLTRFS
jgi:hypothetical protein